MTLILFINDLYYSNPFGFIGAYYDWLILNIKLIFAHYLDYIYEEGVFIYNFYDDIFIFTNIFLWS